jgi:hypothetical protein
LTLPFFMSLRTVAAGDFGALFLPNQDSSRLEDYLG